MDNILDEASALVQCQDCPWYKACVTPMRFSPEDLRRQMQSMPGGMAQFEEGMSGLLANIAAAAQNVLLEGCPIFIQRLRQSPKLAQQLKRMMQGWGMEEEPSAP